jgi:AcrR family transcriptional regulator
MAVVPPIADKIPEVKRSPGRPRSESARQAILRSTLKLLETTNYSDLSIEAIAAHADAGKATVYRWWPDKAALIVDAFFSSSAPQLNFPNTGSIEKDLSTQMTQLVRIFKSRRGRIVAALLGEGQSHPDMLKAYRDGFMMPRRKEAYATLQRGIERGELPRDLDMDLMLDALYGPIYMRFLIEHDTLGEQFVHDLCRLVILGVSAR